MFWILVVFLISLSPNWSYCQDDPNCPYEVVSDLGPHDCLADNSYYNEHSDGNACLPECVKFKKPRACPCNTEDPAFKCVSKKCVPDPEICGVYYAVVSGNNYAKSFFRPTCQKDLLFAPKQCKGDIPTGRCYCFNQKGYRIFGQEWANKAQNMTCACSRRRSDLEASNSDSFISLHCDSMGNYEPLQCDVDSGQCWCVEPQTGELTSTVVPEQVMNRLPCYNQDQNGGQYMRQCESMKYGQFRTLLEFRKHGTKNVMYTTLLCDDDGAYGRYSVSDGIAYCTWRDGTHIKTWQTALTEIKLADLTCNCARDSIIYANAGKDKVQQCFNSGNYNPYQQIGGVAYCVDSDGFKNTDSIPNNDQDCLLSQ